MNPHQAVELIRLEEGFGTGAQTWCDLGCGTGVFTVALATLLPAGSIIYAIDKEKRLLRQIPESHQSTSIRKVAADFLADGFEWSAVDGVLLANSLHFVREQSILLGRLAQIAKRLLIVEYERHLPSMWHPYPLSFKSLEELLLASGRTRVEKLRTQRSRYGGEMYAALAE